MKLGHVTASLLVQKMQAYPQQNALALALQEYGRLLRTIHVLTWYANNSESQIEHEKADCWTCEVIQPAYA